MTLRQWSAAAGLCLLSAGTAHGQITLDGSLGPARALAGPDFVIAAADGRQLDGNLFHSFGRFNIGLAESATFTGPDAIANVIARVTGGEASRIDGTLRSTIADADVFLVNPSGVLFGAGARLDVQGSFHASTADYLRLDDGSVVWADPARNSSFTAAPPAAFGFLSKAPAGISVSGSSLEVAEGKTLSLVGGDIAISGGPFGPLFPTVSATSGLVQVVSVASSGEVASVSDVMDPRADVSSFGSLGTIDLSNGAAVSASGSRGGTVQIRSGRLLLDSSVIEASPQGVLDSVATGISLEVTDEILLDNGSQLTTTPGLFASGSAGDIRVSSRSVRLGGNSTIASNAALLGTADAGDIAIAAARIAADQSTLSSSSFGAGDGGDITLRADSIALTSGAVVLVSALSSGQAGSIELEASDLILLAGRSPNGSPSALSSGTSSTQPAGPITIRASLLRVDDGFIAAGALGSGAGATIDVIANRIEIINGGQIDSSTATTGLGGKITLTAAGDVSISGTNARGEPSALLSVTEGSRPGGDITVRAARITVSDGAVLSASSRGTNDAGRIELRASDFVQLEGGTVITNSEVADGGDITIFATALLQLLDSEISATVGGGRETTGGNIVIDPTAVILENSRIVAQAFEGRGGNISITAGIVILDPSSIISASSDLGIDGVVNIDAPDSNVEADLSSLPSTLFDASRLLRPTCSARTIVDPNRFAVTRRSAEALAPESYMQASTLPRTLTTTDSGAGARSDSAIAGPVSETPVSSLQLAGLPCVSAGTSRPRGIHSPM